MAKFEKIEWEEEASKGLWAKLSGLIGGVEEILRSTLPEAHAMAEARKFVKHYAPEFQLLIGDDERVCLKRARSSSYGEIGHSLTAAAPWQTKK